jgi:hypothetical protein
MGASRLTRSRASKKRWMRCTSSIVRASLLTMSDDDDVREVKVEPEARGVRFRFDQGLESFDSVDKETMTTAVAIVEL